MFMPTKIVITHKETKAKLELSTEEFAHVRKEIGVSGKYQEYETVNDETSPDFAFAQFRDFGGVNNFFPQVKEALSSGNCFGPSFKAFQEAMSEKDTAETTTIITARGHNPESMLEALLYLKEVGLIRNVPKLGNIYPVSSPKIKANASNPSDKKLEILINLIDKMELESDSESEVYFGFSDDDLGTYKLVSDTLAKHGAEARWKNVNVVLYFTGKNPESVILTEKGFISFFGSRTKAVA